MSHVRMQGHVDAFLVSPAGRREQVVCGANTLLYSCADAVARVFGGMPGYRPVTIGFVYGPERNLDVDFAFTAGDRTTHTQRELVGSGLQVYDQYIEQNRRFAAKGPEYTGNVVTFNASKPDTGGASFVYGVLLKDAAGNVLAVKRFDSCVAQPAGYAFAAEWSVVFT